MGGLSLRRMATGFSMAGSLLTGIAILLPWWELHSSILNGQLALFDFTIGPLGISINTSVGDPRILLAPLEVLYLAATIALLPVSSSLALAAFNGVYCVVRKRTGLRVLIAPIWGVIALSWWAYYFQLVYGEFSNLGLNIAVTGSADVTWGGYQLIGAAWGWGAGLYLTIVGIIVLAAGGVLAIRSTPPPQGITYALGFHSVGLLLLAVLNLLGFVLVLPLVGTHNPAAGFLAPVPAILLFVMVFLARRPKTLQAYRDDLVSGALPRPVPIVPAQNLPIALRPRDQERFCFRCGKGLPEGSLFCPTCGANLNLSQSPVSATIPLPSPVQNASASPQAQGRFCFRCGKEIPEGSLFCPSCGTRL